MLTPVFFDSQTGSLNANSAGRWQARFDDDWLFVRRDVPGGESVAVDESRWRLVTLPHDWGIESPFNPETPGGQSQGFLEAWGVGWYRKHFRVSPAGRERRFVLGFDGVFRNCKVWLNGREVGGRPSGYAGFFCDLAGCLNFEGDNVVAVRVDRSVPPSDRWYSGAGIYRHVWLVATEKIYTEPWGMWVATPEITEKRARVNIRGRVRNEGPLSRAVVMKIEIMDPWGAGCAVGGKTVKLSAGGRGVFELTFEVKNPKLWSLENPVLYSARLSLLEEEGRLLDDVTTPFGIREIRFEPNRGFFLNGQGMKFKGVNLHHDLGCLGTASLDRAWERRLEILKSMGCNAIRTSHNPPVPELLDLCDRMGLLVLEEAFDKWKWKDGYSKDFFDEWWRRDLAAMIERDRNHPCVVIWSVGNEVENQGEPEMARMLEELAAYARRLDPSRPVTFALEPHCNPKELVDAPVAEKVRRTMLMAGEVDLLGCNYQEQWYDDYHRANPDLLIVGTEAYPYYRGRGNAFAAFEPSNPWFDVEGNDYVLGQFLWAGIDYLGEAQAWPSKGWASCPVDLCGFRKPQSWYHQSVWSGEPVVRLAVFDDFKREPLQAAHWSWPALSDHWDFPGRENRVLRVAVFTNCEAVELYLNGGSLGCKRLVEFANRVMEWNVPYAPGVLRAVGRDAGGRTCTHELRTSATAVKLALLPDRQTLNADGQDLVHVEVRLLDEKGVLVQNADVRVCFELRGPAWLVGVGNGDLDSNEPFVGLQRRTYLGRCLAVIRAKREPGLVELTASAGGVMARFSLEAL